MSDWNDQEERTVSIILEDWKDSGRGGGEENKPCNLPK